MLNENLLSLRHLSHSAHPQYYGENEAVGAETKLLCEHFGIALPHIDEYLSFTGYWFPNTTYDRLIAINLCMGLLFYLDDRYERNITHEYTDDKMAMRRILEGAVEILCGGEAPAFEHEIYPVCREIHQRFVALMPLTWLQTRLKLHFLQHLKATLYKTQDVKGANDSVDPLRYMALRELDSGVYAAIVLIELAANIYLPDEVMEHEHLKAMTKLCARVVTFTNDLFSYEKEVLRYGSRFNLIAIFEDAYHQTFAQAVDRTVRLINDEIAQFEELYTQIPDFGDAETNAAVYTYVDSLREHIEAVYWWQLNTNRYRSPNSPFPELRAIL